MLLVTGRFLDNEKPTVTESMYSVIHLYIGCLNVKLPLLTSMYGKLLYVIRHTETLIVPHGVWSSQIHNAVCIQIWLPWWFNLFVRWCFKPSQPIRITSGLHTGFSINSQVITISGPISKIVLP